MGFGVCCSSRGFLSGFGLLEKQVSAVGICPGWVGGDRPAVVSQFLRQPSVNALGPASGEDYCAGGSVAFAGAVKGDQVVEQVGVSVVTHVGEAAALIADLDAAFTQGAVDGP